jgi:glycosyltransferase involved in cell wall biosynthesis
MNEYLKRIKNEKLQVTPLYIKKKKSIFNNENSHFVSVITPLYNQGQYLEEAILSVINQTYKNWEMIICDDCSTDNSFQIAQQLVQKYSHYPIKLICNPQNMGVSAARNNAIQNARGYYIVPLDSDDMLVPTMLDECINAFKNNATDIVTFNEQQFGDYNNVLRCYNPIYYKYSPFWSIIWRVMYRKEMWEKVGGYAIGIHSMEDNELVSRFYIAGYTNAFKIDKCLLNYRRHANSAVSKEHSNVILYKAMMVMNSKKFYHKYYVMWAEGVLSGNLQYIKLDTGLHKMPDFIHLLAHFEKDNWEIIRKELEEKYIPLVNQQHIFERIPINMPDGSLVELEYIGITIGHKEKI